MAISAALTHVTSYRYDRAIRLDPHIIRLRPAPHARTPVTAYSLKVEPKPHFLNWLQDPQGNWMARLVFPEPVTHLRVTVDLVARLEVFNPFDFFLDEDAREIPFEYLPELATELAPFLHRIRCGAAFQELLDSLPREPRATIDFLVELNALLQRRIAYTVRMEPGVQTPNETLLKGSGSCRDSAWLLVQLLRHLGLAARFVSGYLIQLKPDQPALDGPSGPAEDFTDLHAWAEVYVPGAGWLGLDPTSGLFAGEGHIPLAASPDPQSAAPISGRLEACEVEFDHQMAVSRISETPRVTKPYSEEQWSNIDQLGQQVDAALDADDVRLTMGGEPTFVSIDHPQAPEWNTAAVGPTKQALAADLAARLRRRFAPGGLLSYGQGKWYPGESLPRWAYSITWRSDHQPVLPRDSARIGLGPCPQADIDRAGTLIRHVAQRLGLDEDCILAAYEDPLHYRAEQEALPPGEQGAGFSDAERDARLRRVLKRPLEEPRGYVLPCQAWQSRAGSSWLSERWKLRRERLYLIPGDSPLGLRLPLDSLAGGAHGPDVEPVITRDPMAEHRPLPPRLTTHEGVPGQQEQHLTAHSGHGGIRTALAVEPRDGTLSVFLPPTRDAEDFLSLVEVVESCAEELALDVRIEGYPPPPDPRLRQIKLTPDPGVIEVNVHPAASWGELCAITSGLYEEARQARLGTEKFLIDGKHTGTGGGNHIVLGGASAPDSPFLRRPDLLASLIRCWQNHPSLSYLFAGLFIGPTSQSPRVDEGRDDALYEMDIALAQLPGPQTPTPPWLADRIFRHLLTDLTGNTHRAEICIDKLFSPDSVTGRLGLVELRGFEMPPHAQMSLVQQLLVRALVSWFWRKPCRWPLKRWGIRLHDEMLLPHYLMADLGNLLDQLRAAGFDFDPAWFDPHLEFRCPLFGQVEVAGQQLELRGALEPWITLGEEPGAGGTARYVDSSVERLQVRMSDFNPERYVVVCNGRRLPLRPTGRDGEFVSGLRFRAWQPWSSLHPGLPPDNPLTIECLDLWSGRSVGGCTYHVQHPAGRNYETYPVNANEAESRRISRFAAFGHSPGSCPVPPPEANPRHRVTLDLRHRPGEVNPQ